MGGLTNMLGLGIVLTLQDKVSAGLEQLKARLTKFGNVSAEMMKKFDEGVRQMMGGFASMIAGTKLVGAFNTMFGTSITDAVNFEQAMARVKAVTNASGKDFAALSKQAEDLGRATQFSATQAAQTQEVLARANFQTAEIIAAMPSLLNMAAAEGMDLSNAADIAATTLRGFGMQANEMNRVANVLAEASRSSNTSIATLGESFKYVATDAHVLGMSIEDTAALVGVLGNAAHKGSIGGTDIRGIINRLIAPTEKGKKALSALGITLQNEQGNFIGLQNVIAQFAEKTKNLNDIEKGNIFNDIFGARPATGMKILLEQYSAGALDTLFARLKNVGDAAADMAKIMNETTQGALIRLESATAGLHIAIGKRLLPVYTWLIDKTAEFKNWLTQLIESHPILTKAVIGLIGTLTTLAGTFLIVTGAIMTIGGFVKMWQILGPAAKLALGMIKTGAVSALSSLWAMSTPVLALIGLAYALYKAYQKNLWGIRDMFDAIGQGFSLAFNADDKGIVELPTEEVEKMKKAGIWDSVLNVGMALYRFKEMWNGFVEGFKQPFIGLKNFIDEFVKIITPAIDGSKALLALLGFDVNSQVSSWKELGRVIGNVVGAIVILGLAFKTLKVATAIVQGLYWAVSGLFTLVVANPIAAAIIAVIGLIVLLYIYWDDFAKWIKQLWRDIKLYVDGVIKFWKGIFKMFMGAVTLDWNKFVDGLKMAFKGLRDMVEGVLNFISDLLKPIIDSLTWVLEKLGLIETDPVKIKEEQEKIIRNQVKFAPPEELQSLIKKYEEARGYNLNNPEALKEIDTHLEVLRTALKQKTAPSGTQPAPTPPEVNVQTRIPAPANPEVTVMNNVPQAQAPTNTEVAIENVLPQAPSVNLPENVNNINITQPTVSVQMPTQQNGWESAFSRLQANQLVIPQTVQNQNTIIDNSVSEIAKPPQVPTVSVQMPTQQNGWESAFSRLQQNGQNIVNPEVAVKVPQPVQILQNKDSNVTPPPISIETAEPILQFPNEVTSLWRQTPNLWQQEFNKLQQNRENNLQPSPEVAVEVMNDITAQAPQIQPTVPQAQITPPSINIQQPAIELDKYSDALKDLQAQMKIAPSEEIQRLIEDYEFVRGQNLDNPEALRELDAHLEVLRTALNQKTTPVPVENTVNVPENTPSPISITTAAPVMDTTNIESLLTGFRIYDRTPAVTITSPDNSNAISAELANYYNAFKAPVQYNNVNLNIPEEFTSLWKQTPNLWKSEFDKLQYNEQDNQNQSAFMRNSLLSLEGLQTELNNFRLNPVSPPQPAQPNGQSTQLLIQNNQNQATMTGNAAVGATNEKTPAVNVNNEVKVDVKPVSTDVYLDSEKVGSFSIRYQETHATRLGRNG